MNVKRVLKKKLYISKGIPRKIYTLSDLDPNWKENIGLSLQYNDRSAPSCYRTVGLNRSRDSASRPEDLLGLGGEMPYYVGHSLIALE